MKNEEIIEIATDFTRGIIQENKSNGMCFFCCIMLQGYLKFLGAADWKIVEGEIEQGSETWNHYWLQLEDGTIFDPTSDQFKKPNGKQMQEFYCGKKPKWYKFLKYSDF